MMDVLCCGGSQLSDKTGEDLSWVTSARPAEEVVGFVGFVRAASAVAVKVTLDNSTCKAEVREGADL